MFKRFNKKITRETAKGPDGQRAYVIGDIHGRLDLLNNLLDKIKTDDAEREPAKTSIVFLGDLIDRGPDSKGVVERLLMCPPNFARCLFISGNHEDTLVRGLMGENRLLKAWLKFGGLECAQSYGVDIGAIHGREADVIEHVLLSAIPLSHINFLQSFHESVRFGDYLFVHAGLRPNVPLKRQSARDMLWIRDEFLNSDADFGCIVVHGHTVNGTVVLKENRIGIDTGAYASGILTALRIEGAKTSIIQSTGEPDPKYSTEDHFSSSAFQEMSLR